MVSFKLVYLSYFCEIEYHIKKQVGYCKYDISQCQAFKGLPSKGDY